MFIVLFDPEAPEGKTEIVNLDRVATLGFGVVDGYPGISWETPQNERTIEGRMALMFVDQLLGLDVIGADQIPANWPKTWDGGTRPRDGSGRCMCPSCIERRSDGGDSGMPSDLANLFGFGKN